MARRPTPIRPTPDPPGAEDSGGGGGNDGGDFNTRLTRLETHFQYLATKEDLKDLKIWWLMGILAGMASAALIALAVARLFTP